MSWKYPHTFARRSFAPIAFAANAAISPTSSQCSNVPRASFRNCRSSGCSCVHSCRRWIGDTTSKNRSSRPGSTTSITVVNRLFSAASTSIQRQYDDSDSSPGMLDHSNVRQKLRPRSDAQKADRSSSAHVSSRFHTMNTSSTTAVTSTSRPHSTI